MERQELGALAKALLNINGGVIHGKDFAVPISAIVKIERGYGRSWQVWLCILAVILVMPEFMQASDVPGIVQVFGKILEDIRLHFGAIVGTIASESSRGAIPKDAGFGIMFLLFVIGFLCIGNTVRIHILSKRKCVEAVVGTDRRVRLIEAAIVRAMRQNAPV